MSKLSGYSILALLILLGISGCYLPLKGIVVDAETNQPIEGAVVLVEWTKTIGIGLTTTQSFKVAEVLSDKDGKFELPGCACPTANEPDLTIYKKGYVAWNNKYIFPDNKTRENFLWQSNEFRLERFLSKYSYEKHTYFLGRAINSNLDTTHKKTIISESKWEHKKASEEAAK